tara:strand:+ start:603 stop:725 length:123 start_codon:yes stop_codon:yes gene_type:complete
MKTVDFVKHKLKKQKQKLKSQSKEIKEQYEKILKLQRPRI